jgi:hypothetical protein
VLKRPKPTVHFVPPCRRVNNSVTPSEASNLSHALTDQIRVEMNQEKRKALCSEVQKILAEDLPYLPLWFNDVVSVHRRFTPSGSHERINSLDISSRGDYSFLATLHPADR